MGRVRDGGSFNLGSERGDFDFAARRSLFDVPWWSVAVLPSAERRVGGKWPVYCRYEVRLDFP